MTTPVRPSWRDHLPVIASIAIALLVLLAIFLGRQPNVDGTHSWTGSVTIVAVIVGFVVWFLLIPALRRRNR